MGLDLFHYKITLNPQDKGDHHFAEEFTQTEIETYKLQRYFQKVPDSEYLHIVYFLNTKKDKELLEKESKVYGHKNEEASFLLGTPEKTEKELKKIEDNRNLNRNQAWFSTGSLTSDNKKVSYEFALYSKEIYSEGLYYNEVGYQRKCMNSQFYEEYKKDFYFNKEAFDNLIKHVVTDDLCSETYENILENFIQNYEQGKSILHVSS